MSDANKLPPEMAHRLRLWIKWKMETMGVSRYRLGELMEIDPSVLTKFMNGDRDGINLETFIRLHTHLHMDLNNIVDIPPQKAQRASPPEEEESPPRPAPGPASVQPRGRRAGGR